MISYNERQEIARKLREEDSPDDSCWRWINNLCRIIGTDPLTCSYNDINKRLADLIDLKCPPAERIRAEAHRLLWESHDCDDIAHSMMAVADYIEKGYYKNMYDID